MSRKSDKIPLTDKQISAQESYIPKVADRAFANAYKVAIARGATVLLVADGQLLKVSNTERVVLRSIEPYGNLKPGTHIKITKRFSSTSCGDEEAAKSVSKQPVTAGDNAERS